MMLARAAERPLLTPCSNKKTEKQTLWVRTRVRRVKIARDVSPLWSQEFFFLLLDYQSKKSDQQKRIH